MGTRVGNWHVARWPGDVGGFGVVVGDVVVVVVVVVEAAGAACELVD